MKTIYLLALFGLVSVVVAKPNVISIPRLAYATLLPGAPVGPDGRVIDTPEVALAKAEHAAAQRNERVNLANEAARSSEPEAGPTLSSASATLSPQNQISQVLVTQNGGLARLLTTQGLSSTSLTLGSPLTLTSLIPGGTGAPIGLDGRVIDTSAATLINAEDAAAQINEQLNLSNEASRTSGLITIASSPAIALRL